MEKASDYVLYLSGIINEMGENIPDDQMSAPDMQRLINKLALKFGEKANTYRPLLVYLKNKPEYLALLEDLITHAGEMRSTTFKQLEPVVRSDKTVGYKPVGGGWKNRRT